MKKFLTILLIFTSMNANATETIDDGLLKVMSLLGGAYVGNKLTNGSTLGSIGGSVAAGYLFDKYKESKSNCPKVDPYGVQPNPYMLPQYRCENYQ